MTLIAALQHDGEVWMLGDSFAGAAHQAFGIVTHPKVFALGDLLVGYTSSFRMGAILEYGLKFPPRRVPVDAWMRTVFIDKVRKAFDTGGFGDGRNETGGQFLVATQGRIFEVHRDFCVNEYARPFAAVGSGADHAMAALHVYDQYGTLGPQERLTEAARVVRAHMNTVAPPWHLRRSSDPHTLITVPA